MNQRRRHQIILENIRRNASVRAEELASALDVSIATIRRDFSYLENHGHLLRTYGGAVMAPSSTEQSFQQRTTTQVSAKHRIAEEALPILLSAKSVILDAGTTTACLAQRIPRSQSLLVATNGLNLLDELRYHDNLELIALGGSLRHKNQAFIDNSAIEQLDRLHVDVCFLGAFGLDPLVGLTSPTSLQAILKSRMVSSARRTYILADASKFHKSFAYVSLIDGPVTIITDRPLSDGHAVACADRGWAIQVADTEDGFSPREREE